MPASRRSAIRMPMAMMVLTTLVPALSGCSSINATVGAGMGDLMPQWAGGLPAGAPARPPEPGVYPAVHDMPAARAEPTLDPSDQARIETDLVHARERQAAAVGRASKSDKPSDQQGN